MVDPSCDIAELIIDLKSQIQDRSPIGALSETSISLSLSFIL